MTPCFLIQSTPVKVARLSLCVLACIGHVIADPAAKQQTAPSPNQGSVNSEGKFTPRAREKNNPIDPAQPVPSREEAEAALAKALKVTQLDDNRYLIGRVEINKITKTISFPAQIEKRSGPIEYALVTSKGKTHESLLSTNASPTHLHLAALLLGIQPKTPVLNAQGGLVTPKEAAIEIRVSWRKNGPDAEHSLASLILAPPFKVDTSDYSVSDARTLPMKQRLWCYNGSSFYNGRFLAEQDGSFIAMMSDGHALINNPLPSRQRDDLFTPHAKLLPADGVPVTVKLIFQP